MAINMLRLDMRAPDFSPASKQELYAAALDMAEYCDEHGFDSVVLSEHHGTDDGYLPAPLAFAGCVLGRTRKIRVGVAALLLPLHDPIRVAEDLAVLDLASGGRVGITAGLGYRPEEYAMFGKDWAGRGKLFDECLEALQKAWSGEPFEWQGRTIRLSPTPGTQPHPPVFVGGMGKNAARRAARFGLPFQPGANHPEAFELYKQLCEEKGIAPIILGPGKAELMVVSEDPDRSWAEVGKHLLHDAMAYASWQPASQRSAVHSDATTVEELRAEGQYAIRTPEECVEMAKAGGALTPFILYPLCGGTPPEEGWKSLKLFAEQVMPNL
ncbi:MAG: LLM class flavin-dependent oxidoreductase [Deltaproteobacteria bacterium]|nr:LLM class flavin-dependent oxidoreductase [Deltaproteobacteria bacterium]MBW2447315.1 LLM class flavin-dependent oxidoreductase [Deltaproteobacteria bacterium]